MAKRASFKVALTEALKAGPATAAELLTRMRGAGLQKARRLTQTSEGLANLTRRLDWRCRHGMAAKMLVAGRNVYVAPKAVAGAAKQFDLNDPTSRLVAADWIAEQGDEATAGLLRRCRRITFGRPDG